MAKLNQPKGYDKSQLPADILGKIESFVDYCNTNFDQLIRAFVNQLTFADNVFGQSLSLSVKHNQTTTFTPANAVRGIIPMFVSDGASIKSFSYSSNKDGSISMTLAFSGAIPIKCRGITYSSPYSTIETTANLNPGDIVGISKCANQNNNGNFQVVSVLAASPNRIVVYNAAGVAETKPNNDFLGDTEASKTVTFFLLF